MDKKDCMYCDNNQKREGLMVYVADLKVSKLYLLKEQTYFGRCVVAYNHHNIELPELTPDESNKLMDDVKQAGRAITKAVNPDKVNYGMYGDLLPHLHVHLVPKKKDGHTFGAPFEMSVDPPRYLSEQELDSLMQKIKDNL